MLSNSIFTYGSLVFGGGFIGSMISTWVTNRWARQRERDQRLFTVRIALYGELMPQLNKALIDTSITKEEVRIIRSAVDKALLVAGKALFKTLTKFYSLASQKHYQVDDQGQIVIINLLIQIQEEMRKELGVEV